MVATRHRGEHAVEPEISREGGIEFGESVDVDVSVGQEQPSSHRAIRARTVS